MVIPVALNQVEFDKTHPLLVVAAQVYVFTSDDLTSGITSVLLFIPVILLGNNPDPIVH